MCSYHTVSPLPDHAVARAPGGLFSVALSFESPRLAISQHPAQRSPDFPRRQNYTVATTFRTPARSGRSIAEGIAAYEPEAARALDNGEAAGALPAAARAREGI